MKLSNKIIWKKIAIPLCIYCFISSIFGFWFLVTFGDEVIKIRKYYVIFVYILQGKMGKTKKKNHTTKVTKIPKTKGRKYGMNETLVSVTNFFFLR